MKRESPHASPKLLGAWWARRGSNVESSSTLFLLTCRSKTVHSTGAVPVRVAAPLPILQKPGSCNTPDPKFDFRLVSKSQLLPCASMVRSSASCRLRDCPATLAVRALEYGYLSMHPAFPAATAP